MNPPYQVRSAGIIDRGKYHSTPGTKNGDIMLIAIEDGKGIYRNARQTIYLQKNMVGLISPEDAGVMFADASDPYRHYYARFSGAYARHLATRILAKRGSRFFAIAEMRPLVRLLEKMEPSHRMELPTEMGSNEILLAQILSLLLDPAQTTLPPGFQKNEFLQSLDASLHRPTDLQTMARQLKLSKTSLCRAVKKATGTTIVCLIEEARIQRAKALLQSGLLNVSEIAFRVGYDDPFYFSRVFKKREGTSPKQWQQKNSNAQTS